jgi:DNA-binding protein HU-beta
MNKNKKDMVDAIALETGFTKKNSEVALNAIMKVVGDAMANGDKIGLSGFGTFEVKERASRNGVNPKNGTPIVIPAMKVVKFKAGSVLKDMAKA